MLRAGRARRIPSRFWLGVDVLGYGVRVQGSLRFGAGVWGLGFGVWGLGFGVWGLGFGFEFLASGLRVEGSRFRVITSAQPPTLF